MKELRDLVRPWRREHGSAVDQLLAERRIEAALEAVEDVDREAAHSARAAIFAQLGRVGDGC